MTALQQRWRNRLLERAAWVAVAGAAIFGSFWWSEFSPSVLSSSGPRFAEFFTRLVPPDWSVADLVFRSTVETLMIAIAGTSLAFFVSLPIGFLAASNVSPSWICMPVKSALGLIRSVPLIVVAVIFVVGLGLGPFPGAMAIAFHSVGMLGKFYAEEFETADKGIIEAVSGTGATWLQTVRFGVYTQSVPQVVSFTVYRLEMNFRDATVLGLVGAGGIGTYIRAYTGSFQYDKVAVLLIVIGIVVFLLDQLTFWVRRWVR